MLTVYIHRKGVQINIGYQRCQIRQVFLYIVHEKPDLNSTQQIKFNVAVQKLYLVFIYQYLYLEKQ